MVNETIIAEFEKLVAFIGNKNDELKNDKKALTANQFRLKQLKNVLSILKRTR